MSILMRHPEHGITVASGGEIEWNEKHGWKKFVREVPEVPEVPKEPEVVKPTIVPPRRGRPPKAR